MHADNCSHSEEYCFPNQIHLVIEEIKHLDDNAVEKNPLPINGKDIMQAFQLKASPLVGECLKWAQELYFENPNATKEEYLDYITTKLIL